MKSLSDTAFSNLDNNIKAHRISIRQDEDKQISNLNFDTSNYVQNSLAGEFHVGESSSQIKHISQRQLGGTFNQGNKLKLISQNSIIFKPFNDNLPSENRVDNHHQISLRRIDKNTSLQMITSQKYITDSNKNSLVGFNRPNFSSRKIPAVSLQLNLKLLSKIKKQMAYFFHLYTTSGRRIQFENKRVRDIISDKGDAFYDKGNRFIQFLYKCGEYVNAFISSIRILQNIPTINADSTTYFVLLFFFVIYNSLFFMLFSLFGIFQAPNQFDDILDKLTMSAWVVEILLKCNTKLYIDKQILSKNRKEICVHYFKKRFLFDFVPLILLTIILNSQYTAKIALKLVVCLKLKNLFEDIEVMQKFLCMTFKNYYIIQLVNLIIKLFMIGHIIACLWYMIGIIELDYIGEETTWFDNGIGVDGTWWKIYQDAIFWSLTLMTTGSNTATTVTQLFFTSFIMLFTTIIFGYMLNVIGLILEELDTKDENKRRDINIINEYMRQKKISKYIILLFFYTLNLQRRVNMDVEYYYEKNFKKFEEDTEQVLCKISKELNEQLLQEYNKQIVGLIPILKNNFTKEALDGLYKTFQEVVYFPNQVIYTQAETSDIYLIFIVQGSVEVSQSFDQNQTHKKIVFQKKKNSIIGEHSFFTGMARENNVKSLEFTKIVKIKRDEFMEAIKSYQKDYQVFCQIKDKILNDNNYNDINHSCQLCSKKTHIQSQCPFVHINRQYTSLKLPFAKYQNQERLFFERKKLSINCLSQQSNIKDQIQLIIQDRSFDCCSEQITQNSEISSDGESEEENIQTNEISSQLNEDLEYNKRQRSISIGNLEDDKTNNKRGDKDKKLLASEFNVKETIRLETLNNSPQVMQMNGRQKYFGEMQKSYLNRTNYSLISDKGLSESQRFVQFCLVPSQLIEFKDDQNSQIGGDQNEDQLNKIHKNDTLWKSENKRQDFKQAATTRINNNNIMKPNRTSETLDEYQIWNFESQQDYKYYYVNGNSKYVIIKHNKFYKKKIKSQVRKSKKK